MNIFSWRACRLAMVCGIVLALCSASVFARGGGHSGGHSSSHIGGHSSSHKGAHSSSHRSGKSGSHTSRRSGSRTKHFSSGHSSPRASARAGRVNASSESSVRSYYKKDALSVNSYQAPNKNNGNQDAKATPQTTHHNSSYAQGIKRDSHGKIARSQQAKDDFKKLHPCPSTGRSSGACPGYVIDHVKPLKSGGADAPSNMQWQTKAEAKSKDKWE